MAKNNSQIKLLIKVSTMKIRALSYFVLSKENKILTVYDYNVVSVTDMFHDTLH